MLRNKTVILIGLFSLLIFNNCIKENIYFNMPENYREAYLYYYGKDGSFKMILNGIDTVNFVAEKKRVYYEYQKNDRYKKYEQFKLELNHGEIDFSQDSEGVYGRFVINIEAGLFVGEIRNFYNDLSIDNKNYKNVYLLLGGTDSMYVSREKGIIKAWNDSITLTLIE
jgi:hypothetical protein